MTTSTPAPELYAISALGQGYLYIMPKPSKERLESDIQYYQKQGIQRIVSLLLPHEIQTLGLEEESTFCEHYGLNYTHFPIKDMGVPDLESLKQLNKMLTQALMAGEHITLHCHGGRGRAGTVAITLMQEFGYSADTASTLAQTGRQDPNVPVCDIQRQFIKAYR